MSTVNEYPELKIVRDEPEELVAAGAAGHFDVQPMPEAPQPEIPSKETIIKVLPNVIMTFLNAGKDAMAGLYWLIGEQERILIARENDIKKMSAEIDDLKAKIDRTLEDRPVGVIT